MKKRVVVIGAGLGGLTASALLSKKGYDVTVIEKHFIVGGYSSNFKRKSKTGLNFNFDTALHGIGNLWDGRNFYELLKNIGVIDRIKILRKKETATVILDDNNLVDIPDSFLKYKKVMLEQFPNERIGIEKLFSFYEEFDKIPFNIVNYNILDSNFNKDTGVIAITIPDIYNNWKDMEREEYLNQKREVTEILLNRVYKYFPKIKEHIFNRTGNTFNDEKIY